MSSLLPRSPQRPWSPVIAVRDIDKAGRNATLTIGRSSVITPAARDRARELSVTIIIVDDAADIVEWPGIQSSDLIEALVEFSCLFPVSAVPDVAITTAQRLLLDSLSVAYAGSAVPAAIGMIPVLRRLTGNGKNRVIGQGPRLPAAEAAMLNATLIHAQDFEAVDSRTGKTGIAATIATAIAAAEETGNVTGRGFLAAIAIALELSVRIGRATQSVTIDRQSVYSLIGSISSGSRLYRLDPLMARRATMLALSNGINSALPGHSQDGLLAPGFISRNTITALKLATAGIESGTNYNGDTIEQLLELGTNGKNEIFNGLGHEWRMTELVTRQFPTPLVTHVAIEAILTLKKQHKLKPERIDRIEIEIGAGSALALGDLTPESGPAELRRSLHLLAAQALHGDITCDLFATGAEPEILAWTNRVSIKYRSDSGPNDHSTSVRIRTTGRRSYSLHLDAPSWSLATPSRDDQIAKLNACWETAGLKTWRRPKRIASAVDALIDAPSPSIVWSAIAAE